jgi:hypothetical protein
LLIFALMALGACAGPPPAAPEPVWVYIASSNEGVEYRVDDQVVELEQLDQAVLSRVAAANPGMSEDQLRRDVRICMRTDAGIDYETLVAAMRRLRFEKIGFVAEDRRP